MVCLIMVEAWAGVGSIFKVHSRHAEITVIVFTGSHSLWMLITYINGETQFPKLSATFMLDDITVGYYDYETRSYVARGNTTNEDDVMDPNHLNTISNYMIAHFIDRSDYLRPINHTESKFIWLNCF